jgi:2-haloalkanoic acid dehalogenase type II
MSRVCADGVPPARRKDEHGEPPPGPERRQREADRHRASTEEGAGVLSERFDAVLIDFYGTICAGDREAVERACDRIVRRFDVPMPAAEFAIVWGERFFDVVEQSNHRAFRTLYECELSSLVDTLRPFVGDVDPVPYVADLEAYWREAPVHPDAPAFLGGLEVPACCVSNADREPLMTAIARHGLQFEAVVCSEDARSYKPDPVIFEQAIARLGVDPQRTVHVGDSLHSDVGGAAKLGITTVWVCREDRIHDIGESKPDIIVSTLTEIDGVLV